MALLFCKAPICQNPKISEGDGSTDAEQAAQRLMDALTEDLLQDLQRVCEASGVGSFVSSQQGDKQA